MNVDKEKILQNFEKGITYSFPVLNCEKLTDEVWEEHSKFKQRNGNMTYYMPCCSGVYHPQDDLVWCPMGCSYLHKYNKKAKAYFDLYKEFLESKKKGKGD